MELRQRMTGAVASARMTTVLDGCLPVRAAARTQTGRPVLGEDCAFAPAGGVPVTLLGTDAQSIRKWYQRQLAGTETFRPGILVPANVRAGSENPGNSPPLHRACSSTIA